jgi:hypothetical protein
MFHIVFVLISVTTLGMGWLLVHSAPAIVARILPRTLTFIIGSFLCLFGAFGAFMDAYYLRDAFGVIGCYVTIVVGLWVMLAPSANARGTYRDEQLMKRIFAMLAIVFFVIGLAMYLPQYKVIAFLNLMMVTGGLWFTTGFLKQVDSGR